MKIWPDYNIIQSAPFLCQSAQKMENIQKIMTFKQVFLLKFGRLQFDRFFPLKIEQIPIEILNKHFRTMHELHCFHMGFLRYWYVWWRFDRKSLLKILKSWATPGGYL